MVNIEYYEGSLNLGADGLSRIEQDDGQLKCEFELYAIQTISQENSNYFPLDFQHLKIEQIQDKQLCKLKNDPKHSDLMGETDMFGMNVMMYKNLI